MQSRESGSLPVQLHPQFIKLVIGHRRLALLVVGPQSVDVHNLKIRSGFVCKGAVDISSGFSRNIGAGGDLRFRVSTATTATAATTSTSSLRLCRHLQEGGAQINVVTSVAGTCQGQLWLWGAAQEICQSTKCSDDGNVEASEDIGGRLGGGTILSFLGYWEWSLGVPSRLNLGAHKLNAVLGASKRYTAVVCGYRGGGDRLDTRCSSGKERHVTGTGPRGQHCQTTHSYNGTASSCCP
mmetsp:Transcript_138233/g.240358  ORF Transcript_138233/g.240358 Transcript_138233/m.240358 type:complete len:239 (+) Transcript_138233:2837-3553(+)